MMPDGYYLAKIVEVVFGDEHIDINLTTRHHTHRYSVKSPRLLRIDAEVVKMLKAQPTKPIHSHEPWKQSVKRQGRQIRKSK